MIPQTFEQWKSCIVNDCKISLTPEFAKTRLVVYLDYQNAETKKFESLYGKQHLHNIINWLQLI
tara:strand:- start:247 stop:438 length:192 start_codon:yes stop_codon:yes gene_type:complete